MDSVVLLHLLHSIASRFDWRLSALHVHHGISPNADGWADFCMRLCERLGITLHVENVDVAPLRDEHGVEAAARKLRLACFTKLPCDFVALAHHADDQVETLLLQLLRGAGIKGGAAMPFLNLAAAHTHATVRPLLDITHDELHEYAQQQGLDWVEDESNADDSYPRNFLRHRLLPLLEQRFPAYRNTLTRSAQHFAEAAGLLDELAQQDGVYALQGETLQVEVLRLLSSQRAKNLLRYFLHTQHAPMPQAAQLDDMLHQLCEAREDAGVCVEFGAWQVRRFQDRCYVSPTLGEFDQSFVSVWRGEAELVWPALGRHLRFTQTRGRGLSSAKLQQAPVTLRLRCGGESLRPHPNASTRSLKNLLQEHHIPPWQRERWPLLYCGDDLVCVAGVDIHSEYQAREDEEGVLVSFK